MERELGTTIDPVDTELDGDSHHRRHGERPTVSLGPPRVLIPVAVQGWRPALLRVSVPPCLRAYVPALLDGDFYDLRPGQNPIHHLHPLRHVREDGVLAIELRARDEMNDELSVAGCGSA